MLASLGRLSVCRKLPLLIVVAGLLCIVSCLPVPLGDPAKSTVDAKLRGYWHCKDAEGSGGHIAVIAPADEHTYIVQAVEYKIDDGAVRPKSSFVFRAWLTLVKDQRFLTLESIEFIANPDSKEKVYPTYNVVVQDDAIVGKMVDEGFEKFKEVKTSADLAKVIEQNLATSAMYREAQTWKRLDPEKDKDLIKSVMR